jgi:transposase InsO family protein
MEVWTTGGLTTFYLRFAMRLATRRVHFAGCKTNPDGPWMTQIARNLTDIVDGPLRERVKYVLMDRDTKFTDEFREILKPAGIKPVLLPPKSPNCNAHLERFFRSLKEEALERTIFFSERSRRSAAHEFLVRFHTERNHQGLDHKIIEPGAEVGQKAGELVCRERLGGLLKYNRRQAAA